MKTPNMPDIADETSAGITASFVMLDFSYSLLKLLTPTFGANEAKSSLSQPQAITWCSVTFKGLLSLEVQQLQHSLDRFYVCQ